MNNLEITQILAISVIGIVVAQALTILLTIRRERDVKELRELVDEQRLQIVELRAWLSGRTASLSRLARPEREPPDEPSTREPIAGNNPKISAPAVSSTASGQSPTLEGEASQAMKVINWQRQIIAGLRAGLKGSSLPESAIAPKDLPDTIQPSTAENELERATKAINLLKEEAAKPRGTIASSPGTTPAKKTG
jgi:hypothetical protein